MPSYPEQNTVVMVQYRGEVRAGYWIEDEDHRVWMILDQYNENFLPVDEPPDGWQAFPEKLGDQQIEEELIDLSYHHRYRNVGGVEMHWGSVSAWQQRTRLLMGMAETIALDEEAPEPLRKLMGYVVSRLRIEDTQPGLFDDPQHVTTDEHHRLKNYTWNSRTGFTWDGPKKKRKKR